MNKEEMKQQALMMLRCQLKIFPNWKELYDSAINNLRDLHIHDEECHKYVTKKIYSAPDMFVIFVNTEEGGDFWLEIDKRILHEIRKKDRWDLVPDIPTFIEVDDEI
ncbi:MAG TPA: hypothetical protein PLW61_04575 [Caldisericia bacterium]|nr:hypothetical protein [Caldisericia bacterium]